MKNKENSINVLNPINQLNLYGFEEYFNNFIKLFKKNLLPNCILLSGNKGLGKTTFAYHFANYVFSINETEKYSIADYSINPNNTSYKHVCNNTHPNFFLIKKLSKEKQIKIEQIRELKKYLNHSTLSNEIKIVLIDDIESLNLNSANALLKSIEEPNKNVFFLIIQDSNKEILDTISSRCLKFNFMFSKFKNEEILKNLFNQYNIDINSYETLYDSFNDTPGNIIKIISLFNNYNKDFDNSSLVNIFSLIDIYDKTKDFEILNFVSVFIENFYVNLCKKNYKNFNKYYFDFNKIMKLLNDMKNFNLSEKNNLIFVKEILSYE